MQKKWQTLRLPVYRVIGNFESMRNKFKHEKEVVRSISITSTTLNDEENMQKPYTYTLSFLFWAIT